MDPASSGDLQKLREAIRHSQNELEPFRQQYRERLVQYAGDGYGDNRDAVDSPFNVYNLALRGRCGTCGCPRKGCWSRWPISRGARRCGSCRGKGRSTGRSCCWASTWCRAISCRSRRAHLLGLARLLNRMMRKLGDQADRQKIVTLVSRAASQNGTGQAAVEAEDGEAIPTDDPKAFTQLRLVNLPDREDLQCVPLNALAETAADGGSRLRGSWR